MQQGSSNTTPSSGVRTFHPNELTGERLGWAVAKAADMLDGDFAEVVVRNGQCFCAAPNDGDMTCPWNPHEDWSQGGPLLEEHLSSLTKSVTTPFASWLVESHLIPAAVPTEATSLLVAAMRHFVLAELGEEVDVPVAVGADTTEQGPASEKLHIQVEFDRNFYGGDYDEVGDFAYVSEKEVAEHGSVEAAFTAKTGVPAVHIIHYTSDERFTADGEPIEEDMP